MSEPIYTFQISIPKITNSIKQCRYNSMNFPGLSSKFEDEKIKTYML